MIKIAIDAGHGKKTLGKRCMKKLDANETREWFLNNRIADKVETMLSQYEVEVIRVNDTTGEKDTPLSTRVKTANSAKADMYISIHHNAGLNGKQGGGTVVYYSSSKLERGIQAVKLYNAIITETGLVGNRSEKAINHGFYVIKNTNMPAFLIENGFMDSPSDVPIILSESHAQRTANGIVNFIVDHFKLNKKAVTPIITVQSPNVTVTPKVEPTNEFKVRINTATLNIRKTPEAKGAIVGTVGKGELYTIVQVSPDGKWGKLKSGRGWIALSYTLKA